MLPNWSKVLVFKVVILVFALDDLVQIADFLLQLSLDLIDILRQLSESLDLP